MFANRNVLLTVFILISSMFREYPIVNKHVILIHGRRHIGAYITKFFIRIIYFLFKSIQIHTALQEYNTVMKIRTIFIYLKFND